MSSYVDVDFFVKTKIIYFFILIRSVKDIDVFIKLN